MRSSWSLVAVLAAAVAASQCSGGGGGSMQPLTSPPPPSGGPAPTIVTISIVGTLGNSSYVPNPVPVQSGEQVVFRNNDSIVHRIVMNDGSGDSGDLAPGASSQPRSLGNGDFHCTIHPSMVGAINGLTAPDPPPGSGDGY